MVGEKEKKAGMEGKEIIIDSIAMVCPHQNSCGGLILSAAVWEVGPSRKCLGHGVEPSRRD
jgi:hypothetical protein